MSDVGHVGGVFNVLLCICEPATGTFFYGGCYDCFENKFTIKANTVCLNFDVTTVECCGKELVLT